MINTNEDWSAVTAVMTVVYATEEPPEQYEKSIFLAGPTPRKQDVKSWRPEALAILEASGYDGVVFVPEDRPDENGVVTFHGNYDLQVEWESNSLNMADYILFWVPRNMTNMPALTTNVEWGVWQDSGKAVFGAPMWAASINYLIHQTKELKMPYHHALEATVQAAINFVGDGALRTGGEREVPLLVWRTPSFQQWYSAQRGAGNELCHAKLLWTFRVGPKRDYVFLWALHVDIYITSEDRHKDNEFVISRPDISTIIGYRRGRSANTSDVVLVREFRSPASNPTAFVWEVPGGSSFKPGMSPEQLAAEEWHEETGMRLAPERFVFHEARQLNATLSAHQAHAFSVKLTKREIDALKREKGVAHGVVGDTERTFVEVPTLGEIRAGNYVDWSILGMIMQVLV